MSKEQKWFTISTRVDQSTREIIDYIIQDTNLGTVSNFVKAAVDEYIQSLIPEVKNNGK